MPFNRLVVERGDGPRGCVDKIPTCHHFMVDYDACSADSKYFEYIEPNCMATCGLCSYDQGNGILVIVNKVKCM